MSQSPGNAGDANNSCFGCSCLSSLTLFVVSGVLIATVGPLDFLYFLLGLSVLMGFITLFVPRDSPTEPYAPGSQVGDGVTHSDPVGVRELRALPYEDYLQTPHWKRKREEKLRAVGYRCQLCNSGSRILDVHHRTYERRGEELDEDLTVLCRVCHNWHHERR